MFREVGDKLFIISSDCTGHGVPGAFITILGRMILREIISTQKVSNPSEILEHLDKRILELFHKYGESDIQDGMDISIMVFNKVERKFYFSGAKSSIYVVKGNEIIRIKGTKYEIGNYKFKDVDAKFESLVLDVVSGDHVYLMSDGYQDQFGGENLTKIGPRKLQQLLVESSNMPMHDQKEIVQGFFNSWKGTNSQTDDVLMIGIKVP